MQISKHLWRSAVAVAAVGTLLAGCTAAAPSPDRPRPSSATTTTAGVHHELGVVYRTVDGQKLTVNACLPARHGSPVPAVLVIHGGGFRKGTNDTAKVMQVCDSMAGSGMAGFSVSYRLAPQHPFPAALDDVQAAVRWLREPAQASRFGIDPSKIGAIGSSAGANLAMELGTVGSGSLASGDRVAAAASFSGPTDMTAAGLSLGTPPQDRIDVALEYLDCTSVTDCPNAEAASPRYQVDPTDAPLFIAHSKDERIPVQQAEAMIDAMHAAGVPVSAHLLPGKVHGFAYLDDAMMKQVLAFFHQYL